jgi:hypothetical protein
MKFLLLPENGIKKGLPTWEPMPFKVNLKPLKGLWAMCYQASRNYTKNAFQRIVGVLNDLKIRALLGFAA